MTDIPDSLIVEIRDAADTGTCDGHENLANQLYIRRCTWFHGATGAQLIYTHDTDHHASGWFKNPDFDRCFHLSLSFREPQDWPPVRLVRTETLIRLGLVFPSAPFDHTRARLWARAVLGEDARRAWIESPKTDIGRRLEVLHYRVFCDEDWRPIKPRGEVYSKRYTPADWRSWSEIHGDDAPPPSHVSGE